MSTVPLKHSLETIVRDDQLHSKWLNTLSLLENTGARKISAAQPTLTVSESMLKHASEESRHAYAMKRQIRKLGRELPTFEPEHLLVPRASVTYLPRLDLEVSRYLKQTLGLRGGQLRFGAYLLVTYGIEVRAMELYPLYQEVLQRVESPVSVKPLIAEEKQHLQEMEEQMASFFGPEWTRHAKWVTELEARCFSQWFALLEAELACQVPS